MVGASPFLIILDKLLSKTGIFFNKKAELFSIMFCEFPIAAWIDLCILFISLTNLRQFDCKIGGFFGV